MGISASLAIVSMALSVSATHFFIAVCFLFFLLRTLLQMFHREWSFSETFTEKRNHLTYPPPFLVALLLFMWLFIDSLLISFSGNGSSPASIIKSEAADLPLLLFGMIIFNLSRHGDTNKTIEKAFIAFSILLILSGIVSLFSEFRLSRLAVGAGFQQSAYNRPQHPAFLIDSIRIYQPIGFMNTKLTYAGLLILTIPFLLTRPTVKKREKSFYRILAAFATILLMINQTRSAAAGFLVAVLASVVYSILRVRTSTRRLILTISVVAFSILSLAIMTHRPFFTAKTREVFRHTDYQRTVIWSASFDLFKNHTLTGVGPGNFQVAIKDWKNDFVPEHPETWYFVSNVPDGHAHNDLLHLLATGGIPAGLLFIFLIYGSIRIPRSIRSSEEEKIAFINRTGLIAFFIAGLAQCYFQDAEVVVFFWSILGYITGSETLRADTGPYPRFHEN